MAPQAIQTRYAGSLFRSRLEARWAAFFDLAGWSWQYEAMDLSGWIPDFVLIGARNTVLVEVKPICWVGGHAAVLDQVYARDDLLKVRNAARDEVPDPLAPHLRTVPEILVLGAYPHFVEEWWGGTILGVFVREEWANGPDTAVIRTGYSPQVFDFHAYENSYAYRIGGQHEGDGHLREGDPGAVLYAWREAGNIVQWQARHQEADV